MSECPAKPGKKCRFHSLRFGGAFCFWCSRIIKRFCVKDGVITEHCHDHTPGEQMEPEETPNPLDLGQLRTEAERVAKLHDGARMPIDASALLNLLEARDVGEKILRDMVTDADTRADRYRRRNEAALALHENKHYDKYGRSYAQPQPQGMGGWCKACGAFQGDYCSTRAALTGCDQTPAPALTPAERKREEALDALVVDADTPRRMRNRNAND